MQNKIKGFIVLLIIAVMTMVPAEGAEQGLKALFQKRSWDAMEQLYYSKQDVTPMEHSLMANAMRLRNKWQEAVDIFEAHIASFPAEVKPYANMSLLLGYEKLGRADEALKLATQMEKNAPQDLRYYIAYAESRLLGDADPASAKKALDKMFQAAVSKEQKIFTLGRLIKLSEGRAANALRLLELQPSNKEAYEILAKTAKPRSASVNMAMGQYAYICNDYKTAIALLESVPQGAKEWRKALYYRGYSFYKAKRYAEALKLWMQLALKGNSYSDSSVRRIAALASRAQKNESIAVLRRVARERKGKVQARAMFALSDLLDEAEAKKFEDALVQAYPDSPHTVKVIWKRGWNAWSQRKYQDAVWYWKQLYTPDLNSGWKPRVLFWIAAAQRAGGKAEEADKTIQELEKRHPLSYYAFVSRKGGVKLLKGDMPILASKPTALEQWGFITYAKLKLQRPKASAKELYRSILLSEWLGEEDGAYAQARLLTRHFTSGTSYYSKGLEYLYPRAFRRQVDAMSQKYGVENNLVWAVMRQESAFKPSATSWAGASGLMQLMPGTAKDEAKKIGLKSYNIYDPLDNITMGASHLARLQKSLVREDWVMAAYNAGAGNARKWLADGNDSLSTVLWIEKIRFDETCDYVQKVFANLQVYRMLYGSGGKGK